MKGTIEEVWDATVIEAHDLEQKGEGGLAALLAAEGIDRSEIDAYALRELPVYAQVLAEHGVAACIPIIVEAFVAGVRWARQ